MGESEVKQQILAAATKLFARRGFGSTSVREVVEAAGVTKPTLYYYFQSKEQLFLAIVHQHLDGLRQLVEHIAAQPGTTRERLRLFIELYVKGAIEQRDALEILMTLKPAGGAGGEPAVDLMSMHLDKIRALGRILQEGVDRGELRADLPVADAVLAFIGSVNLVCVGCLHGVPFRDDHPDVILDLFFRGVGRS